MKTVGIIAEYNPFHKGHQYQMNFARENLGADYIVVAMSGDFVQRGTPALLPKEVRTEMALRCGADLVLELPVAAATASAEFFARGGVELLDGLGVVDALCFGSEAGEIGGMMELAQLLIEEPEEYRRLLKDFLGQGLSFPAARSQAVLEYFKNLRNFPGDDFDGALLPLLNEVSAILETPNNILGIEYCKAILRLGSSMKPVTVKRQGSGYHDEDAVDGKFASATAIRKVAADYAEIISSADKGHGSLDASSISDTTGNDAHADDKELMQLKKRLADMLPSPVLALFQEALTRNACVTDANLDALLHYCLLMENEDSLIQYLDVSDSLARRVINQRNQYQRFSQFAGLLKTKEITQTRIQRALIHTLLKIKTAPAAIPYARVLGFRRDSSTLLKEIKNNGRIPLLTKLADASNLLDQSALALLEQDTFSANLYEGILSRKTGRPFVHEYEKRIVII